MGNKSTNITSPDFNPKDWIIADRELSQNQCKGNYQILENTKTGELIDQYEMRWPSEEQFVFYLDSYNWRKHQYNIVQSKFIVQQHNQQFCSKTFQAKVYIEHIPTRLSDITDIPYPDNLYVLLSTLQGYQKLYENLHYFMITEDQICVDRDGVVKVWVNSNLSKNYPESDNHLDYDKKDQSHMVEELMNMVWENTDEESEPSSFKEFFMKKKGKKRIGFDQAKVIVNEYAKNTSSQIPEKFVSILQMREQSQDFDSKNEQNQNQNEEYQFQAQNNGQFSHNNQMILSNNQHNGQYYQQAPQMYNSTTGSTQFYHLPNSQFNPAAPIRSTFIQAPPLNYSKSYVVSPSIPMVTRHVSPIRSLQPVILTQQFMPKSLGDYSGPILSIPPTVKGARFHLNVNKKVIVNRKSQLNQKDNLEQNNFILEDEQEQAPTKRISGHNINESNLQEDSHISNDQGQQQHFEKEDVNIFLNNLNNRNQEFQQRVSTLNMANLTQVNNTSNNHKEEFSESQRYSQKNQANQLYPNQNNQFQSDVFGYQSNRYSNTNSNGVTNSRNFANKSHQFEKNITNSSNHFINNLTNEGDMLDLKYYTIDQEMELDEQIAADLKRFIMAA